MYNHKNSSVEEDMENDADNELDENETGSDFLSGTFTRYSEDIIVFFPFITTYFALYQIKVNLYRK